MRMLGQGPIGSGRDFPADAFNPVDAFKKETLSRSSA